MGFYDLEVLMTLRDYCQAFHEIDFKIDKGNFDTAVFINEFGKIITPESSQSREQSKQLKQQGFHEFVPDLYNRKFSLVIEYQEEPKPMKGPKIIKKGHTEFSDEEKDLFYKLANIKQLKIWESDQNWMQKIDDFLMPLYAK